MATPSSSATSPSPPMAYLPHTPIPTQLVQPASYDTIERDQRNNNAVQKFMARAEISTVTRALRARLSYASYKATHNIPHVPLRDLETQTQPHIQSASFSRTIAAKRKAAGNNNNHYNNPATQSPHGVSSGGLARKAASGPMAPPPTSPRLQFPVVNGSANTSTSNFDSNSRTSNPVNNMYTSILAPPPSNHARTVHNVNDPPVAAPSRPSASPRARGAKAVVPTPDNTRPLTKAKQSDKSSSKGASPVKRKAKRSPGNEGRSKHRRTVEPDNDGDVDMKAAATLTSLLLSHRPPGAGSLSSPRSSIDSSETGSAYSYSHFAQSSARTAATSSAPVSAAASTSTIPEPRTATPPPTIVTETASQHTTPRPAPSDNEAADLMLFLATSPSPARAVSKDAKDLAAYRSLGGSSALRAKGRVLFPEPTMIDDAQQTHLKPPNVVTRGVVGDSSFASSLSSIGSDMGGRSVHSSPARPMPILTPAQLLPPPTMSSPVPGTPPQTRASPKPPQSSGAVEFNFHEFINASPSPSRGTVGHHKGGLGLRADVGRKLFEEEQLRHGIDPQAPTKRLEEQSLSAGIDLSHS